MNPILTRLSQMTRSPMRRFLPLAACFGLTLSFLSACAQNDVTALDKRRPLLSLEAFFAGDTVAYGIFEDRFGNLKRQFRVNITGTIEDDVLILDEQFLYDDGERNSRIWRITRTGIDENGHIAYDGTAVDINGVASGIVAGNALNWRYDVTLDMGGTQLEVHFDDWIYQQDEHIALNRAYVSKYNIDIGSVSIVFVRGDAAAAIGPLNLESWSPPASSS
ncbi:DUF3833 domain-containing protein [Alphaproteobacteria bacterium]|jgi:hypothetical protein|nr:DUF3833 domain-containing protein [Alphaproteobacteria bacterium]MDA9765166.1 DUF3833 domain-containing protein [Alphaproteobacteria bacterium]